MKKTYYCERCRHNHRWESKIGSEHRDHSITLFDFEMEGILLHECLVTHPYNPLSIQYRQWFVIVRGDSLIWRGTLDEQWLTWDGKDVQGCPTTPLGYPIEECRK